LPFSTSWVVSPCPTTAGDSKGNCQEGINGHSNNPILIPRGFRERRNFNKY
jgi:hypothetical protein